MSAIASLHSLSFFILLSMAAYGASSERPILPAAPTDGHAREP